jgi:hypothetical protein
VHVKAFGELLRRWTVDYEIIPHFIGTDEARAALDALVKRTWPDAFGNMRGIDMLAIDGNAYTKDVFAWAKTHPWTRVIVVRGAKSDLAPPLALTKTERKPDGAVRKTQKRFYNVGVSSLKSALYEVLRRVDPLARGYCGYPKGLDDEFYRQLTAEKREITRRQALGLPQSRSGARTTTATRCSTPRCTRRPPRSAAAGTRARSRAGRLRAEREKINENGHAGSVRSGPRYQHDQRARDQAKAGSELPPFRRAIIVYGVTSWQLPRN